jgi:adenine-specific DNA glycosylase
VTLPGVGRKTANVVMSMAFGVPTLAVDTHVFRIGNRLADRAGQDPDEVEQAFLRIIPEDYLFHAHHWLILHGRYCCKARKPECERCVIADICKSKEKTTDVPAPLVELPAQVESGPMPERRGPAHVQILMTFPPGSSAPCSAEGDRRLAFHCPARGADIAGTRRSRRDRKPR